MGCGCGKGMRNTNKTRPVAVPRVQSDARLSSVRTPSELQQLANAQGNTQISPAGLDAARRETESKRRAAIRKALGKG